jgi:hypothetical protein
MLIKRLLPLFITVLLLIPTLALSEMQEIKEYTVKGGDTLWDISNKELQDPFLWPKIWKENPEIANPDRIYPHQSLKIPLYLLRQEEKAEPVSEPLFEESTAEPIKEAGQVEPEVQDKPIVSANIYLASGYIADLAEGRGQITGSPDGKNLFGNNDFVYVRTDETVNVGDKFYIIRRGQEVKHPVTKEKMGYVIEVLGVAEISRFEYGETIAKILISFQEIENGDLLDTYSVMEPPVISRPFRRPDINGYVVASKNLHIMNGSYDIVYTDKGRADGLQPGDVIKTLAVGEHRVPNGNIQIISLGDNTATAIVIQSTAAVTAGNEIVRLE